MARDLAKRLVIEGTLRCRTPLHVGGLGGRALSDMPVARDGAGRFYIPGTSLAGPLRAWCFSAYREDGALLRRLWGKRPEDAPVDDRAGRVIVEDAPVLDDVAVEVRDGVGIDRVTGAAADRIKYARGVLPRGTRFGLRVEVELLRDEDDQDHEVVRSIVHHLVAALGAGDIRLGAGKTRGLGRIAVDDCAFVEEDYTSRAGLVATLAGRPAAVDPARVERVRAPRRRPVLRATVRWRPDGPFMVKSGREGIAVDMLPLVSANGEKLAPVLPGSSIKGALRAQAERIVRTVLDDERDPGTDFLDQVDVELVAGGFGAAGRPADDGDENADWLPGRGALAADDCYATTLLDREAWEAVEAAGDERTLKDALARAGAADWTPATHVAIDRWTGGAAESLLFNVLEPGALEWEPMELSLDLERLPEGERLPCVALLLLTLADLADGAIPLGYAGNRGMGAIADAEVEFAYASDELPELRALDGRTLAGGGDLSGLPGDALDALDAAWQRWIHARREGGTA